MTNLTNFPKLLENKMKKRLEPWNHAAEEVLRHRIVFHHLFKNFRKSKSSDACYSTQPRYLLTYVSIYSFYLFTFLNLAFCFSPTTYKYILINVNIIYDIYIYIYIYNLYMYIYKNLCIKILYIYTNINYIYLYIYIYTYIL